jgi:tryptophan halogenase
MYTKSICVLGGGTAGLISSLILKETYPNINVTLIKSDKIDIVGVGEGSTEHWRTFMEYVGIDFDELIVETGATFKNGILFENWNGDGNNYYHTINGQFMTETFTGYPYLYHKLAAEGSSQLDLVDPNDLESRCFFPLESSTNQFHFDTFKLNEFLINKCVNHGINVVTDTIKSVNTDAKGISKLISDNTEYTADVYIDASGFGKFLINELENTWKDCTDVLPMNSAITFPTPQTPNQEINSYTRAISMDAGWLWNIPTQTRFGNGYVFCDKYITEEEAHAEVEKFYGTKIDIARSFKFGAGYLTKPWVQNCVAIGLSGSFIEPLEATNIGTAIQQSFALASHLPGWHPDMPSTVKKYNEQMCDVFENTVDFVQLHYITKRHDTPFWKDMQDLKLTDFNKETLPIFKQTLPTWTYFDKRYTMFNHHNWLMVLLGLEIINKDAVISSWNAIDEDLKQTADVKHQIYFSRNVETVSHREAINIIIEDYS